MFRFTNWYCQLEIPKICSNQTLLFPIGLEPVSESSESGALQRRAANWLLLCIYVALVVVAHSISIAPSLQITIYKSLLGKCMAFFETFQMPFRCPTTIGGRWHKNLGGGGTNLKCVLAKGTKGSSPQTENFAKDKKKLTPQLAVSLDSYRKFNFLNKLSTFSIKFWNFFKYLQNFSQNTVTLLNLFSKLHFLKNNLKLIKFSQIF